MRATCMASNGGVRLWRARRFAFGILLGCMATGEDPNKGPRKRWRPAYKAEEVAAGTGVEALAAIYHRCVMKDPAKRPTMAVVTHLLRDVALQLQVRCRCLRPHFVVLAAR